MTNQNAGDLLTELLRAAHLNNSEAARRAGVSLNTIKTYRAGTTPNPTKLKAVAALFAADDAARLVEAFGYPGLTNDARGVDEAQVLADIIAETEHALTKLKDAYDKIMRGRA